MRTKRNSNGLAAFVLAGVFASFLLFFGFSALAGPDPQFDFPISQVQSAANSNSVVTVTNAAYMTVNSRKDLMIVATMNAAAAVHTNATVGLDVVYGPRGSQRTANQPLQVTCNLLGVTNQTATLFVSRTNFTGAVGIAVQSFGLTGQGFATNATAVNLLEVSGNWEGD